jgi:hypothetical protein
MSTLSTTNLKNPSSGSNNIVLGADGSVTVGTITGTSVRGGITSGTAVASTSGTSIDFTGIPSWVKRVTVMFNQVSTNGATQFLGQIGAGSIVTTGYISTNSYTGASTGGTTSTAGFILTTAAGAAYTLSGHFVLTLVGSNIWAASCVIGRQDGYTNMGSGTVTLSGTLDRVRITTVNGTDTFDAGSINILYEG